MFAYEKQVYIHTIFCLFVFLGLGTSIFKDVNESLRSLDFHKSCRVHKQTDVGSTRLYEHPKRPSRWTGVPGTGGGTVWDSRRRTGLPASLRPSPPPGTPPTKGSAKGL